MVFPSEFFKLQDTVICPHITVVVHSCTYYILVAFSTTVVKKVIFKTWKSTHLPGLLYMIKKELGSDLNITEKNKWLVGFVCLCVVA